MTHNLNTMNPSGKSSEGKPGEEQASDEESAAAASTEPEPEKLNIKEIDGPGNLAHNEKGIYTIKNFNRDPLFDKKKSVNWVVKQDGKKNEGHEMLFENFARNQRDSMHNASGLTATNSPWKQQHRAPKPGFTLM